MADFVAGVEHALALIRIGFERVAGDVPTLAPNSPREIGDGEVIPREINPDIASKSKVRQAM
jgi:hypothetical protein